MFDFDHIAQANIKERNTKWPEIPNHPYKILIVGGSGSRKINALINIINLEPDIDKIYLYEKDPYHAKYQMLIIQIKSIGLKYLNDSKAIIILKWYVWYWRILKNKKWKILIIFKDMIVDMLSNKQFNTIVTELWWKLNISLVFIIQFYFAVLKNIRLNSTLYFVMKILNERGFQQIAFNLKLDIDFEDFIYLYKNVLQNYICF